MHLAAQPANQRSVPVSYTHLCSLKASGVGYDELAMVNGKLAQVVKVRAKINKLDNKTLAITEIPYGKTTSSPVSYTHLARIIPMI